MFSLIFIKYKKNKQNGKKIRTINKFLGINFSTKPKSNSPMYPAFDA